MCDVIRPGAPMMGGWGVSLLMPHRREAFVAQQAEEFGSICLQT